MFISKMEEFELLPLSGKFIRPKKFSATIITYVQYIKPSYPTLFCDFLEGGLTIAITALSVPFIFPFFRRVCLPYVPATTRQVMNVLEGLKGKSGTLVDLGSGDGRLVIAAARQGFQSTGVELNPWLVAYSKAAAFYSGVHKKVNFYKCDLWKFDLKPYKNVIIFGVDSMMEELEAKFLRELDNGSCIVACRFPLNKLKPVRTIGKGIDRVWIYQLR